jgi:hypothetical protein
VRCEGGQVHRRRQSRSSCRRIRYRRFSQPGGLWPYWLTYRQAAERGGNVRKGEKSETVVFWKFLEGKDDGAGVVRRVPLARAYHVFNAEQCDGIAFPSQDVAPREVMPIEAASRIEDGMPNAPKVVLSDSPHAFYSPVGDEVQMCAARYCVSDERYHETLLYELTHSTGHRTRLNRFEEDGCTYAFGSKSHAVEELVAEIGSAFLCARAGIFQQVEDDNGAYLAGWLSKLRNHKNVNPSGCRKGPARRLVHPQRNLERGGCVTRGRLLSDRFRPQGLRVWPRAQRLHGACPGPSRTNHLRAGARHCRSRGPQERRGICFETILKSPRGAGPPKAVFPQAHAGQHLRQALPPGTLRRSLTGCCATRSKVPAASSPAPGSSFNPNL